MVLPWPPHSNRFAFIWLCLACASSLLFIAPVNSQSRCEGTVVTGLGHRQNFVGKKILHLEASSGWGGQEMRILREAQGMRERGYEVIFGVMKGGQLVDRARTAGVVLF